MLITINNFVSFFKNLLEEAAYQQNIVLQASQALNVAESSVDDKRGSPEVLEGERLLLLASKSFRPSSLGRTVIIIGGPIYY